MAVRVIVLTLFVLAAVGSQHTVALIGPGRGLSQSPAEFLRGGDDSGVYVGAILEAKFFEGEQYERCPVLYRARILDVLSGPEFKNLNFCSGLHLDLGGHYLLFVSLSVDPAEAEARGWTIHRDILLGMQPPGTQGSVRRDDAFPISMNKHYGTSVLKVPAIYVDFPESLYLYRYSESYPHTEYVREYVVIDWLKLRKFANYPPDREVTPP